MEPCNDNYVTATTRGEQWGENWNQCDRIIKCKKPFIYVFVHVVISITTCLSQSTWAAIRKYHTVWLKQQKFIFS